MYTLHGAPNLDNESGLKFIVILINSIENQAFKFAPEMFSFHKLTRHVNYNPLSRN